jgi:hypothetical protein
MVGCHIVTEVVPYQQDIPYWWVCQNTFCRIYIIHPTSPTKNKIRIMVQTVRMRIWPWPGDTGSWWGMRLLTAKWPWPGDIGSWWGMGLLTANGEGDRRNSPIWANNRKNYMTLWESYLTEEQPHDIWNDRKKLSLSCLPLNWVWVTTLYVTFLYNLATSSP